MTGEIPWAIVTPSYSLDLERCELLCRSMDSFLRGLWHHYIVVDPVDLPLFKQLVGPQRTLINKTDVLPEGMRFLGKVPFMRLGRLWWSWRHGPVFGWQMQQIVKILMASFVSEDAIAFCDSDIIFLKPFDIGSLAIGGKIRFGSVESPMSRSDKLVSASIDLLGLSNKPGVTKFVLGDQIVTWHKQTAVAMQDYLFRLHGKPWHEAIGSTLMFSEFQLYSLFVDYIQKTNTSIFRDNTIYCKTLWSKKEARAADIRKFCAELGPSEVAVCIQSLIGVDIEVLRQQFENTLHRIGSHERLKSMRCIS